MSVTGIQPQALRHMKGQEGLILQGCGGSLDDWVDGINELLTKEGILQDGTKFHDCVTFEFDKSTCLLFPFAEDVKLDVGKLAIWRLQTHTAFGGTWLSDFVPNRLGGYLTEQKEKGQKPDCPLIGQDGNIFNLMGIASRTLKGCGMATEAAEMRDRIMHSESYDHALCIIGEYVNITSVEDMEDESEGMVIT